MNKELRVMNYGLFLIPTSYFLIPATGGSV